MLPVKLIVRLVGQDDNPFTFVYVASGCSNQISFMFKPLPEQMYTAETFFVMTAENS